MQTDIFSSVVQIFTAARATENLAKECSYIQAQLTDNMQLKKALLQQSKQENTHAMAFDTALALIGKRQGQESFLLMAIGEFEKKLKNDLSQNHLATSVYALQYVLESLGAVALEPNENEIATWASGVFSLSIRKKFHSQERAHKMLGEQWAPRLLSIASAEEKAKFPYSQEEYIELAKKVISCGMPLLSNVKKDKQAYEQSSSLMIFDLENKKNYFNSFCVK